jgi:hypothetical protein
MLASQEALCSLEIFLGLYTALRKLEERSWLPRKIMEFNP